MGLKRTVGREGGAGTGMEEAAEQLRERGPASDTETLKPELQVMVGENGEL